MSATLIKFPSDSGLVRSTESRTAAAASPVVRRPPIRSFDSSLVGSGPSHRAPVISLPLGRRPSFFWPIAGSVSGATWSALPALIFGLHWWLLAPVVFGAIYGQALRKSLG